MEPPNGSVLLVDPNAASTPLVQLIESQGYLVHTADSAEGALGAALQIAPDIVMAGRKLAIFVHGCFWHGHHCARGSRVPKTNRAYWVAKIARNKDRDRRSVTALKRTGWRPLIVWECETGNRQRLANRLLKFLERSFGP